MKILLDESLPRKLKNSFKEDHEVWTVRDKGWLSKKNGVLLKLMIDDGFHLFVTADRNLQYQQNLEKSTLHNSSIMCIGQPTDHSPGTHSYSVQKN